MRIENLTGQGACFHHGEAQEHGVGGHREDRGVDVVSYDHVSDQHRIDADADHEEKTLKGKG
jgi:hypothetical protein